ncbi:cell envelope integrity protein TolA [Salmonella enterica]|uniref:Cell envelope integrity protein TolA n=1 Tax=Salmonella enterica subsp. enterica serovar Panama TaxID=29472 RepID=A0A751YZK6_SALET|nr:cell envelope integrity protein TolA [Salmonella enterica]HAF7256060.1 cell envelope integrity protein TolA [Salmonella enterica subsp. enterica serovar Panama]
MGIVAMLKSIHFISFCVLLFSVQVFADSYNSSLNSDSTKSLVGISSYLSVIRNEIKNQLGDSLEIYKGMICSIKIGLLRDGTIIYVVYYSGDSDLCNTVMSAVRSIKKFPSPPSEQLYQAVKDFTLDIRP